MGIGGDTLCGSVGSEQRASTDLYKPLALSRGPSDNPPTGTTRVALSPGARLGQYEILSLVGAGGMGEVYHARDTKLDRDVAIKILPEAFAADPHFLERFTREAKTIAALTHPNIVTLFSAEESDGRHFLTMELVPGRPLSAMIQSGGLPLEQFFGIAIPLVDAVAAAHNRSVMHRDLKPANVMVTDDGRVKVLDFGLARITTADRAGAVADLPTVALTGQGRIVGTVAYMSPEQAEGREVDQRSDIFSIGILLYEMLTGQPPFTGETSVSVLSSIMKDTPPLAADVNPRIPRELARIVRRALAKDPEFRYQSAKDLRNDLIAVKQDLESGEILRERHPVQSSRHARRSIAVGGAIVLVTLGIWIAWMATTGRRSPPTEFSSIKLSRLTTTGKATLAAISPDGRYVVHAVRDRGRESLWMRQVATTSDVQIVPPEEINYFGLTFGPDGNYVYYAGYRKGAAGAFLFRIPILGGAATRVIGDIDSAPAFSPDGARFAFVRGVPASGKTQLLVADTNGANARILAARTVPQTFQLFVAPAWAPDGKTIVVAASNAGDVGFAFPSGERSTIVAIDIENGSERQFTQKRWEFVSGIAWLADQRSLVIAGGSGMAFDNQLWLVTPSGENRRITNDLTNYIGVSLAAPAHSLVSVQGETISTLSVIPGSDAHHETAVTAGSNRHDGQAGLSWTGDGRIVFTSTSNGNPEIWITNADGSGQTPLTQGSDANIWPCVTHDNRYIVFASSRGGPSIWRMGLAGDGLVRLTNGPADGWPLCAPDSQSVLFESLDTGFEIRKTPIDGGRREKLAEALIFPQAMSPDGTTFSGWDFQSDRQPGFAIAVRSAIDGSPIRWFAVPFDVRVSGAPFFAQAVGWAPDGKAIQYVASESGVGNIWSQPLDGGAPRRITDFDHNEIYAFAWSPDGTRLAVARGSTTNDVVIVTDTSRP